MYFVEKTKGNNYFKKFDYILFGAILILSFIGIAALKSAIGEPGMTKTLLKQILCLAIGIVLAVIIAAIDYKDFKTLGIALYIVSIVLLVLVLGSKNKLETITGFAGRQSIPSANS